MPIYNYKAKNRKGRTKRGQVVGMEEADAIARLRRQELSDISLKDVNDSWETKLLLLINPIKSKDLAIFSRQFSIMVSANVTVVEALLILIEQTKNISLQKIVADIAYEVDSGDFLSDALARRPKIFSVLFINIVKSGETSGRLDEVLNYLADEIETNHDMVSKIKGAMIYPIFILSGLVIVGVILMVYVIPNLTSVIVDSGATLPMATRIVIATSNFLQKYILLVLIGVILIIFLFKRWAKTKIGRWQVDNLKINLPIFGVLLKYIYIIRFSRALSTLIKGGVNLTKGLRITIKVVNNVVYQKILDDTLQAVNDGKSISSVMENQKEIPKMVPHMLSVGERTGKLDSVLDKIVDFYDREVSNMLANLSTIMEPLIMVIMGIGVGIMVAAILMPMYNLASQF
jgi:type IV pilus assembly protein PilC